MQLNEKLKCIALLSTQPGTDFSGETDYHIDSNKKRVWCTEVLGGSLFWLDGPGPGPAGHSCFVSQEPFLRGVFACMLMLG